MFENLEGAALVDGTAPEAICRRTRTTSGLPGKITEVHATSEQCVGYSQYSVFLDLSHRVRDVL